MMHLVKDILRGRTARALHFRLEERLRGPQAIQHLEVHIAGVIDWLLRAQRASPDDGVAESYHVRNGRWRSSYPETTGYIISALLRARAAGYDPGDRILPAARRMGAWLVTTQLDSGAFPGGTVGHKTAKPAVFNTGQILKGLSDLISLAVPETPALTVSAARAADWLVSSQDKDGCWRKGISALTTEPVHSYNVRSAWALARYGKRFGADRAVAAAIANGRWTCSVQDVETGWFAHMNFNVGENPLVHTIAYTIRGLLELGVLVGEEEFIDRAVLAARHLFARQDPETGAFPGRCHPDWRWDGRSTVMTSNAQAAIIGYRLAQVTGQHEWRAQAWKALRFCQSWQDLDHRDENRRGALRGNWPSLPGYGQYWYMNWTQKFFLDALLAEAGQEIV